jgi:transposase
MERIVERPGALDVHKESVTACVRVWDGRELEEHMAEFRTTVQGLLALRDWLEALAVKQVAMEATGVYWRPVWAILEDRFELMLVNARHVKAVPGVKQRAEVLIAEIGVDMSVFPTPKHLASWAKVCPGNDESAGKRRSGRRARAPYVARNICLPMLRAELFCPRPNVAAVAGGSGLASAT